MENLGFLTRDELITKVLFVVDVGIFIGRFLQKTGRCKSSLTLFHECVEVVKFLPPCQGKELLKGHIYNHIALACLELDDVMGSIKYSKMGSAIQSTLPIEYIHLHSTDLNYIDLLKALQSYGKALGTRKTQTYRQRCEEYLREGNTEHPTEYNKNSRYAEKEGVTIEYVLNYHIGQGNIFLVRGDPRKAIECFQEALSISQEMGDKLEEGRINSLLGRAYQKMDDPQRAMKYNKMALNLANEMGDIHLQGQLCNDIGSNYISLGNYTKALKYFDKVAAISEQLQYNPQKIICFLYIGVIHEETNDLKRAIAAYEHSIELCEEIEELLGNNEDEHKVSISDIHGKVYCQLSRVLINDNQEIKALVTVDRGRTRALADLMRFNYGIQSTSGPQRKMLNHNEIQQIARTSGNTTLVISINFSRLHMWVIQPDGSITFRETITEPQEMKPNHWIKPIVDKAYDEIGVRQVEVKCEDRSLPDLYSTQDEFDTRKPRSTAGSSTDLLWETTERVAFTPDSSIRSQKPMRTTSSSLTALYDLIIAPVADLLEDGNKEHTTEELVFAPDGPLCLAPFAAIQGPDGKHLCDKFRIRVIPSLTTLHHIRSSPVGYHSNTGALIVGDPDVGEVYYKGEVCHIGRLPGARKEARMIGRLLKVKSLTGHKATKEEVLSRMASVSLVHLAAHGHPDGGEIALAPNPSAGSGIIKEKDYLLSMADVLSAKLRAKLVVLSCYHSGRGEIKAEGVVGIARAFLGAGARSVLVSLWAINDAATLYFMQHFYQFLVQGQSASVALHQATRKLKNLDISETKHWAPFLLVGDDVNISV